MDSLSAMKDCRCEPTGRAIANLKALNIPNMDEAQGAGAN